MIRNLILVFLVCLGGSIIQGVSGFGNAMFVMSLLPFVMPLKAAAVVTTFQTIIMGGMISFKLRRNVDFKLLSIPLLASIVSIPAGVYVLVFSPENILKKILSVLIIVFAIVFYLNEQKGKTIKTDLKNGVITGTASGIMSGMFNIGGPPLVFYFLSAAKDMISYKASLEFTYAVGAAFVFVTHAAYGNINAQVLEYSAFGLLGTTLGSLTGLGIFRKIDKRILTKGVFLIMLILGTTLMIDS